MRAGAELAAARERLGWTLPDIAAHLRIRLPFLIAIEQGRLDQLPGSGLQRNKPLAVTEQRPHMGSGAGQRPALR